MGRPTGLLGALWLRGLEFRVQGLEFRVWVQSLGLGHRVLRMEDKIETTVWGLRGKGLGNMKQNQEENNMETDLAAGSMDNPGVAGPRPATGHTRI